MFDKDYCNMTDDTPNNLIDLGKDKIHPGPEHNLQYAKDLFRYSLRNLLIFSKLQKY